MNTRSCTLIHQSPSHNSVPFDLYIHKQPEKMRKMDFFPQAKGSCVRFGEGMDSAGVVMDVG